MKLARRAFPGKDGKIVAVKGRLNLDGDVKKTKYKLHWVADVPQVTSVVLRESAALRFRQSIEMVFMDLVGPTEPDVDRNTGAI